MANPSNRMQRINQQIKKEVSIYLMHAIADMFCMLSISEVITSKDLSHCKVFVLCDKDASKVIIASLNEHATKIRQSLSKTLQLRVTPEIRFMYDESQARVDRISQLLKDLPGIEE